MGGVYCIDISLMQFECFFIWHSFGEYIKNLNIYNHMSQLNFLCCQGNFFFIIYLTVFILYFFHRTFFLKLVFIYYSNFIHYGDSNKKINFIFYFLFGLVNFLLYISKKLMTFKKIIEKYQDSLYFIDISLMQFEYFFIWHSFGEYIKNLTWKIIYQTYI
jgi:hypothetical protein